MAIVPPPNNAVNMDAGYTSNHGQLKLTWDNSDFGVNSTSIWKITDTTIADNFSVMSTSSSKPSPIFGVFSVSPIALTDLNPTPSNWVTGPSPVPLPAAAWLFGSALIGLVVAKRKMV